MISDSVARNLVQLLPEFSYVPESLSPFKSAGDNFPHGVLGGGVARDYGAYEATYGTLVGGRRARRIAALHQCS